MKFDSMHPLLRRTESIRSHESCSKMFKFVSRFGLPLAIFNTFLQRPTDTEKLDMLTRTVLMAAADLFACRYALVFLRAETSEFSSRTMFQAKVRSARMQRMRLLEITTMQTLESKKQSSTDLNWAGILLSIFRQRRVVTNS